VLNNYWEQHGSNKYGINIHFISLIKKTTKQYNATITLTNRTLSVILKQTLKNKKLYIRSLIDLGLFRDYDDIRNSPRQTFGDVMPGDIKYKDVNGDGVINDDDVVAIGATTRPNLTYGFGASARWKGFNISAHFQGVGKSTYFINGSTVYMFSLGDGWGNVLEDMARSNRWISSEISGDPATEDPDADYPRLSYGANSNNYRQSTFWLRNGSYIRLKTLDIGYTLPKALVNRAHFNEVRVFFIGTNLLTFSKFKLWDPEMGSSDGKKYPLSKSLSLGIAVNL